IFGSAVPCDTSRRILQSIRFHLPGRKTGSLGCRGHVAARETISGMIEAALKTSLALGLAALAATYAGGWRRLRVCGYAPPLGRLGFYALGLGAVGAALLSRLDDLAATRFSSHMGQHLLLTMMAAPLVLLGNPLPFVLWGLPVSLRSMLAAPF